MIENALGTLCFGFAVVTMLVGCIVISMLSKVGLKYGWRGLVWLWKECDNSPSPEADQVPDPKKIQKEFFGP